MFTLIFFSKLLLISLLCVIVFNIIGVFLISRDDYNPLNEFLFDIVMILMFLSCGVAFISLIGVIIKYIW